MINALTIDIEDYFHIPSDLNQINNQGEKKYLYRVERNTNHILELLNRTSLPRKDNSTGPLKATFFCFGWIAKKIPQLIKDIQAQGHEVACHGYRHHLVYTLSKNEFKKDIQFAKALLEDLSGKEVIGYRAPCYSITKSSLWALKILAEAGFKYDSSVYPVHHNSYGYPEAPRFPFWVSMRPDLGFTFSELQIAQPSSMNSKIYSLNSSLFSPETIIEFPLSTVKLAHHNLPISDGGHFHRFPYFLFKRGLKQINQRDRQPFIFYLHPWELAQEHLEEMERREERLKVLIKEFPFSSIRLILGLQ